MKELKDAQTQKSPDFVHKEVKYKLFFLMILFFIIT
jgi:hypothetical protein